MCQSTLYKNRYSKQLLGDDHRMGFRGAYPYINIQVGDWHTVFCHPEV